MMILNRLLDRVMPKKAIDPGRMCEHGLSLHEICDACVDEFVANFHLTEEGQRVPVSNGVEFPIGRKDDTGKAPVVRGVIQYFPNALQAVAQVSAFGAKKYDWGNWKFVADGLERYTDALGRHIASEGLERRDSESGLLHAAHAAWNALARLEFLLREEVKQPCAGTPEQQP